MSDFRTIVEVPEYEWEIDYSSKIMMLGSCFSENIGEILQDLKYNVDLNPFGILYNPVSIKNSLEILLARRLFKEDDLFEYGGKWNSYFHHSRFSSVDKGEAVSLINERINHGADALESLDYLVITFGTSWIYELKTTGLVVSNCHRVPASEFSRYRISVMEMIDEYRDLLERLWSRNPKLKVLFTVSPIRHWKDGAVENQLSKSMLIMLVHQLVKGFGEERVNYFPSYEIMMDDLRDYRFYADDMLHPSQQAVKYIWKRFKNSLLIAEDESLRKQINKLNKAVHHRAMNSNSIEYEKFVKKQLKGIENLKKTYPSVNFDVEYKYFFRELEKFN
ncbi:GSCFA domain protein [Puteibacter caeruleilacunae]|nr:GSCFA domain protein [Puteibacter caeruleilacunae]